MIANYAYVLLAGFLTLQMACATLNHEVPKDQEAEMPHLQPALMPSLHQIDNSVMIADLGIELVPVAVGSFIMGSEYEGIGQNALRQTWITDAYWIGRTEVTLKQWRIIMGYTPYGFMCNDPSFLKDDDLPVSMVSFKDCIEFCNKLTERERAVGRLPEGYVYRLPTEVEWEYAARGGERSRGYKYSGGDDLSEVGWYSGNSPVEDLSRWHARGRRPRPVGLKKPNELGIYDMSGNMAEWCHGESTEPLDRRVVNRGGDWFSSEDLCQPGRRLFGGTDLTQPDIGFRVVLARDFPEVAVGENEDTPVSRPGKIQVTE